MVGRLLAEFVDCRMNLCYFYMYMFNYMCTVESNSYFVVIGTILILFHSYKESITFVVYYKFLFIQYAKISK